MAVVHLSVGTNINRYYHVTAALDHLADTFGELLISRAYESEAVGFEGDDFLNLVATIETDWSVGQLSVWLKKLEDQYDRTRSGERFSARTLDIDILTYDDAVGEIDGVELPRDEIAHNAFVLLPLSEVAPAELHPQLQKSYASLWRDYDHAKQALWVVEFNWRDQKLPINLPA